MQPSISKVGRGPENGQEGLREKDRSVVELAKV